MKVLVTGASGFSGRHMIRYMASLQEDVPEIYGLYRSTMPERIPGCTYIRGDLKNRNQIAALVRHITPDAIIHLAGLNQGTLEDLLIANVIGTENLLESAREEKPDTRVLVIGSSAEYGFSGEGPIPETAPLRPVGNYGVSKAAEDLLAMRYAAAYNLPISVARPFNLVGPGQPPAFVCGRIVAQAVEIESGRRTGMELAGLDARRDFVDVRDAARAYWMLIAHEAFAERCAGKAFNVGSGRDTSVAEVLRCVEAIAGTRYEVALPPSLPAELVPTQRSDNTVIEKETGWEPEIPLRRSLEDMILDTRAG